MQNLLNSLLNKPSVNRRQLHMNGAAFQRDRDSIEPYRTVFSKNYFESNFRNSQASTSAYRRLQVPLVSGVMTRVYRR